MVDLKATEAQKSMKMETPLRMQVFLGIITNLVIISPGMNLGFSAVALPALKSPTNPLRLSIDEATWVASITSVAMPFGCLLSGPLLDRLGRKFAMYSINICMIVGWGIIFLAGYCNNVENLYILLLIGRFITGIGCGLCSVPATVYMSEISTPNLRGMVCAWSSVAYAIGVQLIYILGYFYRDNWVLLAGISAIIPVFCIILLRFLVTESPTWYQNKGRYQKAENSLAKLQGYGKIRRNLIPIKEPQQEKLLTDGNRIIITGTTPPNKSFEFITKPECYKPFICMALFFFFQQFSGIFVIIFYAVDIVKSTGSTIDPYIAAICIGGVRTVTSMTVSFVSKKFGRRIPSISSGIGMTLCMLVLSGYLHLTSGDGYELLKEKYYWVPLAALMMYFFTSTFGFLTMPFAMIGEVYPAKHRGIMGGLTACFCYIFSFVIVKSYPMMVRTLGRSGLFLSFSIISLIGTLFVIIFLPETKGKTLQEIEALFVSKISKPEKVLPSELSAVVP